MRRTAQAAKARYGLVLRLPHARALLLAQIPSRAPIAIIGLAIVLFVREHVGSYGTAGLTAGVFGLTLAISSPLLGRLIDRVGLVPIVVPATIVHSGAIVGLVVTGLEGGPIWLLVVCSGVAGAALPPLGSISRALWPRIIEEGGGTPDLLSTAFAIEGILIEMLFTVGPLITATLSVIADPAYALLLAPTLLIGGVAVLLPLPPVRSWRIAENPSQHGVLGALRSRGLRTLMLCTLPMGFCFGAVEVTLPAFAEDQGSRALGGLLLAAWSLGSALGGLTYGAIDWQGSLARRYARLAALLPLGFAPLALAPSIAVMAVLTWIAGLCIAPVLTAGNQIVGDLASQGTETEAFTWPITSLVTGIAAGNAVAGLMVTHVGLTQAFLAGAAAAVIAAGVAWARWPTLVRPLPV